jgi:inorganic phosphate transporter, PiT family
VDAALLAVVVAVALGFCWTNGFHDAANVVATSVSTRALTPHLALVTAACFVFVGGLLGEGVARTVGSGIIVPPPGRDGLVVVLAALLAAIGWNLLTWSRGIPSSSSHALIGGLIGAGLASATQVRWSAVGTTFAAFVILAPVAAAVLGAALMVGVMWAFRHAPPGRTNRRFRAGQTVSAAAMALGHGLQDAQKTIGVIVLALLVAGAGEGGGVPGWARLAAAAALATGVYAGGWRITRTLGRRVIELDPPRGFTAETVAAGVLWTTATVFAAPVSSTHTITSAIAGVGATRRLSAVRWTVAADILIAWALTMPATALSAAALYAVGSLLV